MYSVEVVSVFNRDNDETTYYKGTKEGLQRINRSEYTRLDSLAFDSDTFYTATSGSLIRNGKILKFLYNPFKEV
jgi:hypothetical protein